MLVCVLPCCAQCMVKLVHLLNSPCPPFEGEGVILVVVKCTSLAQKCVLLKMMILTAAEGRRRYLNGEEKKKKKRKKKIKTFPTLSVPYFLLCVCVCTWRREGELSVLCNVNFVHLLQENSSLKANVTCACYNYNGTGEYWQWWPIAEMKILFFWNLHSCFSSVIYNLKKWLMWVHLSVFSILLVSIWSCRPTSYF